MADGGRGGDEVRGVWVARSCRALWAVARTMALTLWEKESMGGW